MDIAYGIDAGRKEMKRAAVAEVFWHPGALGGTLIEDLNARFGRNDANDVLWELVGDNIMCLSAEGRLWLVSGWTPWPDGK